MKATILDTVTGEKMTVYGPRSVEIISDDERTLLYILLEKDGTIEVSAGEICKHGGKILNDRLEILPSACNRVTIRRPIYIGCPL